MLTDNELFCANPECHLHVCQGDENVIGTGQWAELSDGIIIGRQLVGRAFYCHDCATPLIADESNSD